MTTETMSAPTSLSARKHSSLEQSIFHGAYLALTRMSDTLSRFFASMAASQRAARHYDRLVHLGDAELAAQGLQREEIPHYVFEQNFTRN